MSKDPIKVAEYNKHYYELHKNELLPKIRKRVHIWQKANRKYCNKQQRNYRKENPYPWRAATSKYRINLRADGIAAYGGECQCCHISEPEFLTLDHANGGGTKHRKQLAGANIWLVVKQEGYPKDKYRVLCWNCNWSSHRGHGVCIHKRSI